MKTVNNFVQSERQTFPSAIRALLPQYTIIPFMQIKGPEYECIIKENDTVSEGQIIGTKKDSYTGNNGASIHSPVPGKVTKIVTCSLPNGKMSKAAEIRVVGSFTYLGKKQSPTDWHHFSSEDMLIAFAQKGIVNTFAEADALSDEIIAVKAQKNKILVVRLFDEDPSRLTDCFVSYTNWAHVVEGACIVAKAMDAEGIVFAVPKKSIYDYSSLEFSVPKNTNYHVMGVDTTKYPSGFKQNLIQQIKRDVKDDPKSIYANVSTKSIYIDPETAYSVYEAIVLGMPVVERYIHVTGTCLRSAGMFKVRVGTTIKSLAEQCGNFKIKPAKIIINGLITGFAISSLDTPITKQVKSVAFVPAGELSDQKLSPCIRCGRCRAICPEGIFPDLVFRHKTGGKPVGSDLVQTALLCSECCLCNSVCPARLPLCQTIALLKETEHE